MIELLCKNNSTGEIYTKKYIRADEAMEFIKFTRINGNICVLEISESRLQSNNEITYSKICIG